ncbi:MAG: hypothetical protein WBI34_04310 [Tenuifilaceae bacterium]|nr:hypothetical protein [Bacteroidales bacterium]MDI9515912.1 hypothetical protein [Bacteroidota bacterium]HPX09115.1 hypothetical protein [Tenuifilaceae bacterium]MZP82634.1 hypothetical protein [Bacteroidales bacterium]HQC67021.1 hypothetical protein [Tenuifilaceae bacterium]
MGRILRVWPFTPPPARRFTMPTHSYVYGKDIVLGLKDLEVAGCEVDRCSLLIAFG